MPPAQPTGQKSAGEAPAGARDGMSAGQKRALRGFGGALVALTLILPQPAAWMALGASAGFLLLIGVHLGAAIESLRETEERPQAPSRIGRWPRYTILAPLYREGAVAAQLVRAIGALDYPKDRLELLLLIETDDHETRNALSAIDMPHFARVVVVPEGAPRTKPRALNYGLAIATGTYVTVFDAEDLPEPDQLKRAVLAFERAPTDVRCLQARLAIDNGADGWLPLMLSIEYLALFDAIKRGLAIAAMPVALGGTSNHFRRRELIALGGWDSWNVAEDADLGLRIARGGGRVLELASTTWEEAPIRLPGWFRQRRRWLKGWIQTGITHSREPAAAIRAMGLAPWLVGQLQTIGIVLGALTYPGFAAWIGWNAATGDLWDATTGLALAVNSVAIVVILIGSFAMLAPALIGLSRRGLWRLAPWLLTLPAYLVLVSAAAWMALWDLWRKPFHWAKTEHGLGRRPTRSAADVRSRR